MRSDPEPIASGSAERNLSPRVYGPCAGFLGRNQLPRLHLAGDAAVDADDGAGGVARPRRWPGAAAAISSGSPSRPSGTIDPSGASGGHASVTSVRNGPGDGVDPHRRRVRLREADGEGVEAHLGAGVGQLVDAGDEDPTVPMLMIDPPPWAAMCVAPAAARRNGPFRFTASVLS